VAIARPLVGERAHPRVSAPPSSAHATVPIGGSRISRVSQLVRRPGGLSSMATADRVTTMSYCDSRATDRRASASGGDPELFFPVPVVSGDG
jgi:hypothetical protein